MTTITDVGLEWKAGALVGNHDAIDAVAVGSGTGNEGTDATSLANQEYKALTSSEDVVVQETNSLGQYEAIITVTGDQEVPAGTQISEIGVYGGAGSGEDVLVVIDEFADVEVEQGHTEEFTVTMTETR